MTSNFGRTAMIGLAFLASADASAGSGFEIVTYSVVGSSGIQEGGSWSIFSAIGQPIVGDDVMGGGFSIDSGFPSDSGGNVPCVPDLTNDGELNFLDISAFLSAYQIQDPIADMTGDGLFNFLDVSRYLSLYGIGCP
jgi:hypothetical protein